MSEDEKIEEYGQLGRRVFPTLYYDSTDTVYVNLVMKLEYEKLTKTEFFRALVEGFIYDDPHIARFIEEHKENKKTTGVASSRAPQGFGAPL